MCLQTACRCRTHGRVHYPSGATDPRFPSVPARTLGFRARIVWEKQLLPAPWDAWCAGHPQSLSYGGVIGQFPAPCNSLAAPLIADCPDHLAMMLRTTRERLFSEARSRWIKTNPKGGWHGLFAGAGQASKHASLQASTDDHLPLSVPHASPF